VNAERERRLAVMTAIAITVITALGFVWMWQSRHIEYGNDFFLWGLYTLASIAYVVAGLAIVRKGRARVIGWLCLLVAGALELGLTLTHYGIVAIRTDPGSLPSPGLALAIAGTTPMLALTGIVLILHLFPTGRPAGARWRPFLALTIVATTVIGLATLFSPDRITDIWSDELSHAGVSAVNPIGVPGVTSHGGLSKIILIGYLVGAVGAVVSLFARRRRATEEERLQLRWLAAVAGAAAIWIVVMIPTMLVLGPDGPAGAAFWIVITPLVALGPPIAIGIAIVKYRLYEIDVVIRKTVVFGVLAAFITAVYVAIVQGLGSLFNDTLFLRIAATAVIAVAFQPVRDRATQFANRLVYGNRATPYEILARFGERVGETYSSEEVLPRIGRVISEGTAAARVDVWLRLGDALTLAASWPRSGAEASLPFVEGHPPTLEGDRVAMVRHQGELLGAIAVTKPATEPLSQGEAELLDRLADQAALVMANARLTADLEARLAQIAQQAEDLRASRQRIVAAQDEERRRLERNIHDGAQQHLVALAVKLRLAKATLEKDADRGAAMLAGLGREIDAALDTLRSLALGIYPPLLEEQGIAAALAAQYLRGAVPVQMETDGIGRYPIELEAAVYFCTLEALQNAAKYAQASTITIAFRERDEALEFSVTDDGVGFNVYANGAGTGIQGMRDRIAVFGGDADIESSLGHGTTVRGRVPIGKRVPA
jgi:signal transduction histidine kinase